MQALEEIPDQKQLLSANGPQSHELKSDSFIKEQGIFWDYLSIWIDHLSP